MHRRHVLQVLPVGAAGLAMCCGPNTWVHAQGNRRVARVGWLGWTGDTSPRPYAPLEALRSGLRELGWKEGDNLVLELRQGERERAGVLTQELLATGVDVIVALGPMVFEARKQTSTVPIVFSINGDPVEAGLAASLARPGGNLTGITALSAELSAKRLELLKAAKPGITRVAVLANDRHPGRTTEWQATVAAAQALQVELKYFPVLAAQGYDAAFAAMAAEGFDGLVAFPDTLINVAAKPVAEFCARQKMLAISGWAEFAAAGNVLSYGPSYHDFIRLTARFVDKLLKGARAAELPVEQPTRFELVLNRRAARAIGLPVPQALLVRADEVID